MGITPAYSCYRPLVTNSLPQLPVAQELHLFTGYEYKYDKPNAVTQSPAHFQGSRAASEL